MLQFLAPSEATGAAAPPRSGPVGDGGGGSGGVDSASAFSPGASGGRLTPGGFSTLFQQHHRALWCIAAAIVRDRELAYDVVQEAAVIALGKLNDFDPSTSFPAWCGQIVRFVALNHRKRGLRSHARSTDPVVMAASAPAVDAAAPMSQMFSGRLADALESLEETPRACLLMKIVMDLSYKHIAEALGIPEGTAMSHVHRSRQTLRKMLDEAGGGGEP